MIRHRHFNINHPSVDSPAADLAAPGEGVSLPSSSGAVIKFQAKASEDNGATGKATMRRADSMAGEASRVDAGRTASATSERMDATRPGEQRPQVSGAIVLPDPYGLYLSIIAAHDRCTREEFLTRAICRRLDEIGISRALDLAMEAGGIEHEHCVGRAEVARRSHKPEVASSNLAPATKHTPESEAQGGGGNLAVPARGADPP